MDDFDTVAVITIIIGSVYAQFLVHRINSIDVYKKQQALKKENDFLHNEAHRSIPVAAVQNLNRLFYLEAEVIRLEKENAKLKKASKKSKNG